KPHFAIWLWIHDPTASSSERGKRNKKLILPLGTPLHYAAFCGLPEVVKVLAIEQPRDVDSRRFNRNSTPLHLASREGHVEVAGILIALGAELEAQDVDG